jgi:hypothetical protein
MITNVRANANNPVVNQSCDQASNALLAKGLVPPNPLLIAGAILLRTTAVKEGLGDAAEFLGKALVNAARVITGNRVADSKASLAAS